MANYVTVSTFGAYVLQAGDMSHERALENMMEHWTKGLETVLLDEPDMIVLPEACDRYGDHSVEQRREYYGVRGDRMRERFSGVARAHGCYIAYSAARQLADGTWRNSTQVIDRQGRVAGVYDKNYPAPKEMAQGGILPGRDISITECDFGRVGCMICFDLNFTELLGRYAAARPQLLLFSSMYHGGLMQRYWAYRCRSYFACAIPCQPDSIINPLGEVVGWGTNYREYLTRTINLDYCVAHLDFNKQRLAAMKKKYGRKVQIEVPPFLGSVLITSETDELTAADLAREFEVELLDDYFARSTALREEHVS